MSKLYPKRVNWKDEPSTETPLNAYNLNKMEQGIVNVAEVVEENSKDVDTLKADMYLANKRIDEISKLPQGSTTGDAELADIRVAYDGKTYDNAGNSVRGQIKDLHDSLQFSNAVGNSLSLNTAKGGIRINSIEGVTHKSKNLFDKDNVEKNKGLSNDGTTYGTGNGNVSAYIPVKPSTAYYLKNVYSSSSRITSAMYNSNKEFITIKNIFDTSGIASGTITTDANASYIRISVPDNVVGTCQVNEGDTALPYEPYGMTTSGSMGLVDLGDLEWTKLDSSVPNHFNATLSSIKPITNNVVCDKYIAGFSKSSYTNMPNLGIRVEPNGSITIKDIDYTDTTLFKTANKGVLLAYELAEGASADKYSLVVEEKGKNLFKFSSIGKTGRGLSFSAKEGDSCITINGTGTENNSAIGLECNFTLKKGKYIFSLKGIKKIDSTKDRIYLIDSNNKEYSSAMSDRNAELDLNSDTKFISCIFVFGQSTYNNEKIYVQLEENSTATSYTPYKSNTVFIPLSKPLCSVGDLHDIIVKKDGKWGVERKFGYKRLDEFHWNRNGDDLFYSSDIVDAKVYADGIYSKGEIGDYNKPWGILINDPGYNVTYIRATGCSSSEEVISALSNQILIYELATTYFEEITEQSALYQLESYADKTYVDTAEGLAVLDVEYGKNDVSATQISNENKFIEKFDKTGGTITGDLFIQNKGKVYPLSQYNVRSITHPNIKSGSVYVYEYGLMIYIVFVNVVFTDNIVNWSTGYDIVDYFVTHLDSFEGGKAFVYTDGDGNITTVIEPNIAYWGTITAFLRI